MSLAAASGVPREERQMPGRWAVKEIGDEYVRSAQCIVARIQCDLLERLRSDREWDLRNAGLEEVRKHITKANYDGARGLDSSWFGWDIPRPYTEAGWREAR